MDYHDISVSVDGGVALATLCRPKALNALSMRLRDELEGFLRLVENDPSVSLVVITGGTRFFSAGWDLKEAAETRLSSFRHRVIEFHEAIYSTRKFVITAVSGIALAGGFDLALAGDLVLAAPSASFGHVEVNFGVNPLVFPLAKRVGIGRAVDLCATGRVIGADEARSLGVVNEVLSQQDFLSEVAQRAREVARMGTKTLSGLKEASIHSLARPIRESLEGEFAITEDLLSGDEIYGRLVEYLKSVGILT